MYLVRPVLAQQISLHTRVSSSSSSSSSTQSKLTRRQIHCSCPSCSSKPLVLYLRDPTNQDGFRRLSFEFFHLASSMSRLSCSFGLKSGVGRWTDSPSLAHQPHMKKKTQALNLTPYPPAAPHHLRRNPKSEFSPMFKRDGT